MFVVSNEFTTTVHGELGCITCHGGENVLDKDTAHAGMQPYPSRDLEGICFQCHAGVTETFVRFHPLQPARYAKRLHGFYQ
jgi:hypothetical protein